MAPRTEMLARMINQDLRVVMIQMEAMCMSIKTKVAPTESVSMFAEVIV